MTLQKSHAFSTWIVAACLCASVASAPLAAQAPTTFNYQGRLLQNTADQDAVIGSIDVVFSMWSGPVSDGSAVELWTESWTGVTLSNGIFSVLLGSNGSPLNPADFQGDTSIFLQLQIDGETLQPRQQLGSAPFAMVDEPANEYQDLSLTGDVLALTNSAATIDLSSYLDDTDEQDLSLSGTSLSLSNDPSPVDLSGFLDNTDTQTLSLAGNTLSISGSGSTVDLSGAADVSGLNARVATLEQDLTRTVFVTSQAYDADLGGLAGADALCQGLAESAGLDGAFLAWLSDSSKRPSTRFGRLGSFELIDGTPVADDWADLTDGTLQHAIDLTELGGSSGTDSVWTNTTAAGAAGLQACSDWNGTAGSGNSGLSDASDSTWTVGGANLCADSLRLYCIEQFSYQTDDQQIALAGNTLSITGISGSGSSVDLSSFVDDTDEQDLALSGSTLSLTNDPTTVNLSGFLDNTDDQQLSLSGNNLNLTSDNGTDVVSLSKYLDNTDGQDLSLSGTTLNISGGSGVNLNSFSNTDSQTLSVSGNNLIISGGNTVSLSAFKDNTDNQDLNSVLSNGSDASNRDITNLDDLDVNDITTGTFECTDCIDTDNIDDDTIRGNNINDNIYILHVECNGSCANMSMKDSCNVIENLRGLSVEVELVGVSCVHGIPSTSGNGFVACDDGTEVFSDYECRAFNLRTLGDLPCVNGDGTDVIVTCLETNIPK